MRGMAQDAPGRFPPPSLRLTGGSGTLIAVQLTTRVAARERGSDGHLPQQLSKWCLSNLANHVVPGVYDEDSTLPVHHNTVGAFEF